MALINKRISNFSINEIPAGESIIIPYRQQMIIRGRLKLGGRIKILGRLSLI